MDDSYTVTLSRTSLIGSYFVTSQDKALRLWKIFVTQSWPPQSQNCSVAQGMTWICLGRYYSMLLWKRNKSYLPGWSDFISTINFVFTLIFILSIGCDGQGLWKLSRPIVDHFIKTIWINRMKLKGDEDADDEVLCGPYIYSFIYLLCHLTLIYEYIQY